MSNLIVKGQNLQTIIPAIQTLSDQLDDDLIFVQRVIAERTTTTSTSSEFLLPTTPPGTIDLARIGVSILSVAITPKNVNNILRFRLRADLITNAAFELVLALVAPAGAQVFKTAVNNNQTLKGKTELFHVQAAGATTELTFHMHIGINNAGGAQTVTLQDNFTGSLPIAFIEIQEYTE